jgi:hypothetical protein
VLRWNAPRPRRVLFVDGEMVLSDLQVRLNSIVAGFGTKIPNDGFRVLAADHSELGINLGGPEGPSASGRADGARNARGDGSVNGEVA